MAESAVGKSAPASRRASFLSLPVEIQLQIFRYSKDLDSRKTVHFDRSVCFLGYSFPPALLAVSRHFRRLGTRVFYKENEFGVAVFDPPFVLTSINLWHHPAVLPYIRTLHLRFEFPERLADQHGWQLLPSQKRHLETMEFVTVLACVEIRRLPALRLVRISIHNDWEPLATKAMAHQVLSKLKALPRDVSFEFVAHESLYDLETRAEVLRALRQILGADVQDAEPWNTVSKWANQEPGSASDRFLR